MSASDLLTNAIVILYLVWNLFPLPIVLVLILVLIVLLGD